MSRISSRTGLIACAAFGLSLGAATSSDAATITPGSVTVNLGPTFFFDAAVTGGNDFTTSNAFFARDLGALNVGSGGTQVTITGFGWAGRGYGTTPSPGSTTLTITYLGTDGVFGGADDMVLGSVTDNMTVSSTGSEYYWAFDTPVVSTIDGLNSQFRFQVASTDAAIRYKTAGSGIAGNVKLSVAGSSVAVPEPSSLALIGLGALACMRRRR